MNRFKAKPFVLLPLAAAVLLSGCGNLFEDEYVWSEPFTYEISRGTGDATEINNYNMLKSALIDLVSDHEEQALFRFSRYNGSAIDDLAEVCLEVKTTNPLCAYAVESLSYDTSRIVSYYLAEVDISYRVSAQEIREVEGVSGPAELETRLREAVGDYSDGAVLRVYSPQVDEAYITDLVERLYLEDPVAVSAEPALEITSFPPGGYNRIYDIRLDYGAEPARLRLRSRQLASRVEEVTEELEAEAEPLLALEAADALYGMLEEDASSPGSTAYDALVLHSADSKGIALAYRALCTALGIECLVVRGNLGDMGAEEHYWNILHLEGAYYHADVSRFGGDRSEAFLLDDAGLWGLYLWDAERFPECTGALRYIDLVPPEETGKPEDPGAPGQPGEPEAPEGPESTEGPEAPEDPNFTEAPVETEGPESTEEPEDPTQEENGEKSP